MKIVIYEIERWEREKFRDLKADHDLIFVDRALTTDTKVQHIDAEVISSFIYSQLSAETLKNFPLLKLIARQDSIILISIIVSQMVLWYVMYLSMGNVLWPSMYLVCCLPSATI